MPEFIECTHPDLPGQTTRMAVPRNGWRPTAEGAPAPSRRLAKTAKKAATTKTSRRAAGKDSPAAGSSTTTKDEE